ncbi:hypothetical protein [Alkalibacillus haloalkaliphilus]|uniref:hypothetical protein n=1 Tax=Alkalibacillus haloalkaliphilus TaxID=94136 RepID=UPI0029366542|nr:hypothetical protein [Alkalibacillus haloalkaliphilus]MDV2582618.1 hypothetical protein [Alkalibacillus haloalkaliphilus]
MRKSYEFFLIFIKENYYNKMAIFWVVFIPLIFFLINHSNWFTNTPDQHQAYLQLSLFWVFMILISAVVNTAVELFTMRDRGFFKMFSFIAGSKSSIIFGKGLANFSLLIISMVLFNAIIALLFQLNPFTLIWMGLLLVFLTYIPAALFFSWIIALPFKAESIVPAFSLLTILLIYLTSRTTGFDSYILLINPAEFMIRVAELVVTSSEAFTYANLSVLSVTACLYIVVGLLTFKFINLESKASRN